MPLETNTPAKAPGANPKVKGKPLGIPKWGWVAGIAVGLLIAYVAVKKSGSIASASDSGQSPASSSGSPLAGNDSGTGGGVVASPPPDMSQLLAQLKAMGLIGGGTGTSASTSGVGSDPGFNDTSNPTPGPSVGTAIIGQGTADTPQGSVITGNNPVGGKGPYGTYAAHPYAIAPPEGSNVHVPGAQM